MLYRSLFFICLALFTVGCGTLTNNYHAIGNEQDLPTTYRSAQMSSARLHRAIYEEKIDVVVNLRGENPDAEWYQKELQVCNDANVEYHSVKMSAYKRPPKERILKLIEIFQEAKKHNKTLLLHCQGGADRSSFGSAVAQMIIHNRSAVEAEKSFSLLYGCLSFNIPLDEIIDEYIEQESQMSFPEWVEKVYQQKPEEKR